MLSCANAAEHGFTLTELLVAGAVGLIVLSGTLGLYGAVLHADSVSRLQSHLSIELRTASDFMARDLRRAGYWAGEPGTDSMLDNPFSSAGNDLVIGAAVGEAAGSCITFSYDRDHDRLLGVGATGPRGRFTDRDNVEQYGFRLHKGALESRISGPLPVCNRGRWQDVTSPDIEITRLHFHLRQRRYNLSAPEKACSDGAYCQSRRHVTLTLAGRLAGRPETEQLLTTGVHIRNDKLVVARE